MRISDWSSDVCSSDLGRGARRHDGTGRSVRHAGQKLKTQSRTRSREMRTFVSAVAAGVMLAVPALAADGDMRSEEHTSELLSLMRISYAVFCLKIKKFTSHTNIELWFPYQLKYT